MAKRKRKGGRRGFRVGKWINLGFKIVGATVAASPVILRAQENLPGNPSGFVTAVKNDYTGSMGQDVNRAIGAYGALLGGVVIAKVGSFLGRRF